MSDTRVEVLMMPSASLCWPASLAEPATAVLVQLFLVIKTASNGSPRGRALQLAMYATYTLQMIYFTTECKRA